MKRFLIAVGGELWWLVKWPLAIAIGILLYAIVATGLMNALGQKHHGWDSDPCPEGCSDDGG